MQHKAQQGWIYGLTAWWVVIALFLTPGLAQAGTITVRANEAKPDFPRSIAFHISATAGANIDRVTLIYGVSTDTCLNSQARHEMLFDPAAAVDLSWDWDMFRSGDLPPGVEVWWQWELHTADGTTLTTDMTKLTVEDPGYAWKKLERGQMSLYWAKGSDTFGASLLNIATASLDRLAKTSGLVPTGSIRLTIYPSAEEMKQAMMHTTDWMGGVAFSEYRIVLLEVPPDTEMAWPRSAIPHELSHLVFGQRIFNCLNVDAPSWLNEGMAMYAEGPVTDAERKPVLDALKKENLQTLISIANGFPADSARARLAYDQSKLVVDFMITQYGKEKLEALLDQFKGGQKTEDALRAVYGLDTDALDQTWRAGLGFGSAPDASFATPTAAARSTTAPTLALMQPFQSQPSATAAPTETAAPVAQAAEPEVAPSATTAPTAAPTVVAAEAESRSGSSAWLLLAAAGAAGALTVIVSVLVLRRKRGS